MSMVSPRDVVVFARIDNAVSRFLAACRSLYGRLSRKPHLDADYAASLKAVVESDLDVGLEQASEGPNGSGFRFKEPTDNFRVSPVGGRRKRLVDVTVAMVALIALFPALIALAIAVKLSMGGPVIYRHRRVGFAGRQFDCLKFRTMVTNGDAVLAQYLEDNPAAAEEWRQSRKLTLDPRVTRFGWLLRKTSLDELPQLLNILRGDMSCVGPRPIVTEELERYGAHVHEYLRARPGVTGSWQVNGRNSISYGDRVRLDAEYVRRWSFGLDFVILARTVPAVFKIDQAA